MSDKRDWQADMKLCEDFQRDAGWSVRDLIAEQPQMSIYWLQQYAAERERADRSIQERKQFNQVYELLLKKFKEAEAREQKLKEAIEAAINEKAQWGDAGNALDVVVRYLSDTLSELYPAVMDKAAEA